MLTRADIAKRRCASDVHEFRQQADGSRIRTFDLGDIKVSVESTLESDARAKVLAESLRAHALGETFRWSALENERDHAVKSAHKDRELRLAAEAKIAPPQPVRLMGVGCVRFDSEGRLYLCSSREKGWAAFAIWLDGWDELFRRYDVRVTAHGQDEHGLWWSVENTATRSKAVTP